MFCVVSIVIYPPVGAVKSTRCVEGRGQVAGEIFIEYCEPKALPSLPG